MSQEFQANQGINHFTTTRENIIRGDFHEHNGKISEIVIHDTEQSVKLQFHEEVLNISKKQVQLGEVTVRKELITEEKNVIVPVNHEILVIEAKAGNREAAEKTEPYNQTIRIPIREERIEVIKHPVLLENVTIYKHQYEETEHIEETLKKERLQIEIIGDPTVIDKEMGNQLP
ncbi:MAG: YsnF/AvaK domain-containing protein [Clostridia bacterium]|nr:YsnF/AvaK domain-containing protein [Clostridia bacterium]